MSIPKAPFELKNHCSAVWNNTVYVYTPEGFQSLSLTQGAKWETLPSGQALKGGICAQAMGTGNEALYIVGGSTTTSAPDYPGLQRFDFKTGSWENITPSVPVTANRRNHGAQYINSTNSILVYAGSQENDNQTPSTQTFLISAAPPYSVVSFNSQGAPPLVEPMLMPWDQDHAVMVGGAADNKQVWTFGKDVGWQNLGTTLVDPITDQATTQCSMVSGDDSSKVLEVYNMGVTPNTVARYALWLGPDNKAAPTGTAVGGPASRKRRRELTVNNWPTYNSSLAPNTSRSAYSLAESASGLVVITGGSDSDPIAMFDQRENAWMNATSILVAKNQIPLTTSTTSLPSVSIITPTATSTSSPTSTPGIVGGSTPQAKTRVLTVLGATLGAIFGLAAILILMLLLLKWKKEKNRKADDEVNEKNGRLSFADQGAEFMHEAGGSRGRAYSASLNSSVTSLQFFAKSGPKSGPKSHTRGVPSDSSQMGLVNGKSPLGANEPMEMSQMAQKMSPTFTTRTLDPTVDDRSQQSSLAPPGLVVPTHGTGTALNASNAAVVGPDADRNRSNGWSRYFANNDVTNLATMQPNNQSTYSMQAETFRTSMSRSEYDDGRNISDPSVRPLELNLGPKFEPGQRISNVNTGSPRMGSNEYVRDGMSAEIRRAGSTSSRGSDPGDVYESTVNTHTTTANYTPQSNNEGWPISVKADDTRSMASSYSVESLNPFAPDEKGEYAPSNPLYGFFNGTKPQHAAPPPALPNFDFGRPHFGDVNRDSSGSAMTLFPSGIGADSPQLSTFPTRTATATAPPPPQRIQVPDHEFDFPMPQAYFGQHRDSTASDVTVFPGSVPAAANTFKPSQPNAAPPIPSTSKPTMVENRRPFASPAAQAPSSPAWRGPVMRKTTGDEDMSWLNINAGKI
ncbi:hypothetical protein FKW77_006608 [Venturia effusa]|uniref:Uncharacterized protein n=1 Tax=Venturia effusa TaxID=50376 RepID=A0A517LFQ7_9PEZI|nr:hypothetical protein FKW77_006608 [Venturia effusa]